MIKRRTWLYLLLVAAAAFFIRLYGISENPPALYGDELTLALDSYSLLKTGEDQTGKFLPLTFSMRDKTPAVYTYFSVPFISLFGPSALGVRFLSIISGVGIVALMFLLARRLFSSRVGLIAAALTAISPWDIAISRGGFESHLALLFALLTITSFIYALKKPHLFIVSALGFGLCLNTYQPYRLVLPLVMLMLTIFNFGVVKLSFKSSLWPKISAILIIISLIITFSQTVFASSESRFLNLNFLSDPKLREEIIAKVNLQQSKDTLPRDISGIFHNKLVEYLFVFERNYLANFSLDFLVVQGDKNPRHNMANSGAIYFFDIVWLLLGLIFIWTKFRKVFYLIFVWLLIAPLPGALISDPHFLRNSFMISPLILLISAGVYYFLTSLPYKYFGVFIIILVFFVQFAAMSEKLYFLSPALYKDFWSYNAKKASMLALSEKDRYDYILLSNRIDNMEFAFPVYADVDPRLVIEENVKPTHLGGINFKKFGNVYIGSIPTDDIKKFVRSLQGRILYIGPTIEQESIGDSIRVYDNNSIILYRFEK